MRPSLARRWLLVGYQKFALDQNGRVNDSDWHGEDERLDWERTSPGLLFLLCTGLRIPSCGT